jgi:hypothetical protein
VPSGLALYWFVNNLLSTGQQAWLKTTYADASSVPGTSAISAADRAEEERQERVNQLTGEGQRTVGWLSSPSLYHVDVGRALRGSLHSSRLTPAV